MGHSKIKTTLDQYSHIVDATVFEGTAQTLDNVYNSLTQKNPQNPHGSAVHKALKLTAILTATPIILEGFRRQNLRFDSNLFHIIK